MSQDAKSTKVASLLAAADGQRHAGRHADALQHIREASALDPDSDAVKQAFKGLQISSAGDNLPELLDQYAASPSDGALRTILQALTQKNCMTQEGAARCLDTVLRCDISRDPWADISCRLIGGQVEARKAVAQRMRSEPKSVFDSLLQASDTASKAMFQVLFEDTVWPSKDAQTSAQRATFRACFLQPGNRASELMLRQLIISTSEVADLADEKTFSRLFACLDMREPQQKRGQTLLAITKLFEAKGDAAEAIFLRLIAQRASSSRPNESVLAFSAVAALFPVVPAVCAKLLLTEGFIPSLVPLLQEPRLFEVGEDPSQALKAVLELLGAACVDKACRAAILQHCQTSLKNIAGRGSGDLSALAALTLAKIQGANIDSSVVGIFISTLLHGATNKNLAIEGLAYASLNPGIKERISTDTTAIKKMIAAIDQQTALSCLTILDNLTKYRPAQSEEQKKMTQLKAYANSSKTAPEDPLDNNGVVTVRCKRLLDAGLIAAFAATLQELKSFTNLSLTANIVNSIAREQKHRSKIAQEGGVKLLSLIYSRLEALQNNDLVASQRLTAHAVSRILISVNPEHVFNASLPATTAVSVIAQLLKIDQQHEERDLLPTFEALLALTNLASMNDNTVRELIIRRAWDTLEDQLLLSSNVLIQRASVELVCNLMLSPSGVAKFADGSDQAAQRLHILLALADVDDLNTRRAAGGALAMLTEWDTAVVAITKIPRGIKILLSLSTDDHDDNRHRGLICVLNCVSIPGDVGGSASAKVKGEDGVARVREVLQSTKSSDVLAAGVDLLKKLM